MKINTKQGEDAHGNETSPRHVKKQEVNLQKNGFIRFQIGLIVAMLLVYFGLSMTFASMQTGIPNFKEETEEEYVMYKEEVSFKIESSEPQAKVESSQKPTLLIDEIEEIDNNAVKKIESTVITEPETTPEDDFDYTKVDVVDEDPDVTVPFVALEDVPIFPGCEKVRKKERKACFEKKMKKHIIKNFKYPTFEQDTGVEGNVYVTFKIDKDGQVKDIQMKSPVRNFEKEAERIISKLPQMTPGKQGGKPVKVAYSVPIVFRLN